MNKLNELSLKGILKTIEGDLQNALYYNSQGIFSKDDTELLYLLRKIESIIDKIKETIENVNGSSNSSVDSK
jgi:hypothetical protein